MINLMAKLDLDSSPFVRGLSKSVDAAKTAGNKIGSEVGKDFAKGLKNTIGAGAVAAAVVSTFRNAQEIRDQAAAIGVTTQQFAAMELVSQKLGDTTNVTTEEFMRLTDEVIASGQVASDSALAQMADDADRFEEALNRVKAAAAGALGFVSRLAESVGAGLGGFWSNLDPSKSTGIKDRFQQFGQFFSDAWNAGPEKTSIAERAQRTERPEREVKAKAEAETKVREERKERQKLGLPSTPFADRSGGSLAAIGLGPGRGTFNLQRQMLDEQRRTNAALRDLPTRLASEL